MNELIFIQMPVDEFKRQILEGVKELLDEQNNKNIESELLTGPEVRSMLKISNTTLWNWDKKGITKPYILTGTGKRYKRIDIVALLKQREVSKI